MGGAPDPRAGYTPETVRDGDRAEAEQATVAFSDSQATVDETRSVPHATVDGTGSAWVPPAYDDDATPPYGIRVPRPPRPADPLAVAVGNASLLGVGYFLMGRRVLGVAAAVVSVGLVVLLVSVAPVLWFELLIVAWWVGLVAHGWVAARSRPRHTPAGRHRLVAAAAAVPVLLAFGLLRFDAAGIEQDVAAARAEGDCSRAVAATDTLWAGHRIADAPLDERADGTVAACAELRSAARDLDAALSGDSDALAAGFSGLRGVLADRPGHDEMVATTLDGFLAKLPVDDPCRTADVTNWLREEKAGGNVLGRVTEVVPKVAPAALVECADSFMATGDWSRARVRYQQLLDQYPDHELAPEAEQGVVKATQAIELANVRGLLATTSRDTQPAYCTSPAPYSGAKPYVPNAPNRALIFGNLAHTGKIPAGWLAKDAADAVVVICAGESEYGTPVRTCPYESEAGLLGYADVTFKKIAIPLRVFEVRTGKLVANFKVEINGASCPAVLEYTSYSYVDLGPPSEVYVTASIADVQAAFRPMLIR